MAIDDNPIEVLRKHFELEDSSKSPVPEWVGEWVGKVAQELAKLGHLPAALQLILQKLNDKIKKDNIERIIIMLNTVADQVLKHDREIHEMRESLSELQKKAREETEAGLIVDGARRAAATRSIARVKRIGIILAHVITAPKSPDEDEIEEMMRVATELTDVDLDYLNALVKIQGQFLRTGSHVQRYTAYESWTNGPWGDRVDPTLDSVFRKLESYGLVSSIAPNNTFNIVADIQTRYALLPKGLRFAELVKP